MTTHLALAQARAEQAAADLTAAEAELLAAMRAIEPAFSGDVTNMFDRRWESRLEGLRPLWELSRTYSAYRRAQRAETKASRATLRARMAPAPPAPVTAPARRPRKAPARKVTGADFLEEARAA